MGVEGRQESCEENGEGLGEEQEGTEENGGVLREIGGYWGKTGE